MTQTDIRYNVETPVPGQHLGIIYFTTPDLDQAVMVATRLQSHVPGKLVIRLNTGGHVEGWGPACQC